MLYYTMLLPAICYFLSGVCDATADVVTYRWKESIMDKVCDRLSKWGWFSCGDKAAKWFNADENMWLNRYNDRDPKKGRKMWSILWFKIPKPLCFTDIWHFMKLLRNFLFELAPLSVIYITYRASQLITPTPSVVIVIQLIFLYWVFFAVVRRVGYLLFYNTVLLKKQNRKQWRIL